MKRKRIRYRRTAHDLPFQIVEIEDDGAGEDITPIGTTQYEVFAKRIVSALQRYDREVRGKQVKAKKQVKKRIVKK